MKFIVTSLLVLGSICSQAQQPDPRRGIDIRAGSLFYSVGGVPVTTNEFSNLVEGTPFFKEEWLSGLLVLSTGSTIKNLRVKIDLVKGAVHYQDQYNSEFIVESALKEVVLTDTAANNNYRLVHTSGLAENVSKKGEWLLWLVSGTASLYKKFSKTVFENKRYGSATTEHRIDTKEQFIVRYNGKLYPVKKLKEIPAVLFTHKKELTLFIQSERITSLPSPDDQFAAVIEYYNTIAK